MPLAGAEATSTSCFPCHSGAAFEKWVVDGKPATDPNWNAATDASYPITCAVCHDPMGTANPNQLRTITVDTLRNGYHVPASVGGLGQLCMNCHRSRNNVATKVTQLLLTTVFQAITARMATRRPICFWVRTRTRYRRQQPYRINNSYRCS